MIHLQATEIDFTPKQWCKRALKKSERIMGTENVKDHVLFQFLYSAQTQSNNAKRNATYKAKRAARKD